MVTDRDVARSLRDRVVANGGRLDVGMRDVRDAFQRTVLDTAARREITVAIREAGLQVDPPLERAGRHAQLTLSILDRPKVSPSPDHQQGGRLDPPFDEPDADAALGAVALTGAVATVAGFFAFGLVGGLVLLALGFLLVLFVAGTDWSARRSFVVSALCLLLLSLLVIAPLTSDEERTPRVQPSKPQPNRQIAALRASAEREVNAKNYEEALGIAEVDLRDRGLARRIRRRAARELLDTANEAVDESPRQALYLARRSAPL